MDQTNNTRPVLRIGLLTVAVVLNVANTNAATRDRVASFDERWPDSMPKTAYVSTDNFICGGVKMLQGPELPAGDVEKTHLRKQRARIRAILNSP